MFTDFIREEITAISIYTFFAWGYRVKFPISGSDKFRVRVIHRCGLYTGFQNITLDFHGLRVIHRCGLYTGNYGRLNYMIYIA